MKATKKRNHLYLYSKAAKLSLENAEQWIKDARLLIQHHSYGHASALLRLAVEETAKAYVCWFTSEKIWPLENAMIIDVFRYHEAKNELFLGWLFGSMWMEEGYFWKDMPELSREEVLEAFEVFENMVFASGQMRQKAMYVNVNLDEKVIETPLDVEDEEPKIILMGAEIFLKVVKYYVEKCTDEEKEKLRQFFSAIPKEVWETGEIPIE